MEDRLEYHQPKRIFPETRGEIYKYTYQPESIDELVDLSQKAVNGNLDMRVKLDESPDLQKLLWNFYGWPQKKPSSAIVADVVDELLSEKGKKRSIINFNSNNLESAKVIYRISREALNNRWTTYNDYNFMFWHTMEKQYAEEEFNRLDEKY